MSIVHLHWFVWWVTMITGILRSVSLYTYFLFNCLLVLVLYFTYQITWGPPGRVLHYFPSYVQVFQCNIWFTELQIFISITFHTICFESRCRLCYRAMYCWTFSWLTSWVQKFSAHYGLASSLNTLLSGVTHCVQAQHFRPFRVLTVFDKIICEF